MHKEPFRFALQDLCFPLGKASRIEDKYGGQQQTQQASFRTFFQTSSLLQSWCDKQNHPTEKASYFGIWNDVIFLQLIDLCPYSKTGIKYICVSRMSFCPEDQSSSNLYHFRIFLANLV